MKIDTENAEGVIFAHGRVSGGHSLYAQNRRLTYAYNWVGTTVETITADGDLPPGDT